MNCTLCHNNNTETKFLKNGYRIVSCNVCNHLFTEFEPTEGEIEQIYSDDYFFKGGAGYEDYTLEKDMLIKRGSYYADKIKKYIRVGKVLDIGAAAGFILKGFENNGWQGTGIEPNQRMVEYGRKVVGVSIKKGTIETVELEGKFDLVVLIQVVAHIYDLQKAFKKIHHLLKPGGCVLIETWNKDSLTARAFGKNWHEYSPPGTLNYFSKRTLNLLMANNDFSLIKQETPKKSINSTHAKSLIKHKLLESKRLKWIAGITSLIPGNMILPYPSEDLFWAFYKRN
jgi:2-polyprenyl-3-methyl-5-hydroxy-6-metoxy-1,4-benzoquinol methylase